MQAQLSFVSSQITRLTDGQTDRLTYRRTDRILIARLRLHSMQRGKTILPVLKDRPIHCDGRHQILFDQTIRIYNLPYTYTSNWKTTDRFWGNEKREHWLRLSHWNLFI